MNVIKLLAAVVMAAAVFVAGPARAEWRKAETEHFIIYGDVSERVLRTYATKIERFDALLRTYYPIESDVQIPKLEIYLADGARDMRRILPGGSENIAGFYSADAGRIYTVTNISNPEALSTLFHEYAHHFMFQMSAEAYPSWFVEGFAEYYSTVVLEPEKIEVGREDPGRMMLFTQLGTNEWAPLADVLQWRISRSGRARVFDYYAQSWALTHYLMSAPERQRMLSQYLNAVIRGADPVVAMETATGRTSIELQNDFRRYFRGRITYFTPQIEIPMPEVAISTLAADEGALVWYDLRLDDTPLVVPTDNDPDDPRSEGVRAEMARDAARYRAELITEALAAAARRPGQRMAMLVAARAHRLNGDPAAGLAALEPLLSDTSTDADALRIAAALLMDQVRAEPDSESAPSRRRLAMSYLGQAMEHRPLDFRIYLGLNDTRRGQSAYPTANDISTLEVATALAPQADENRLRLAEAYMARSLWSEAKTMLDPVANAPHPGADRVRARSMLAAIASATGAVADVDPEPVAQGLSVGG
ncbi:DUF1570 domain-containing protein [Brevundimonas sp. UBA2416]|uniref:DUF1570 domain-containing protein n=1 Tax=Brevundimonas sp. UBA2416 TaxID=1946124 RepID=UPI0025BE10D5|nr:DUF1570 domain-containing protein [Brevundimonas sp. UBA2416]